MSDENASPPIDKEPVANGNASKLSIELPTSEKKELELVVKNDTVVNQPAKKYGETIGKKRVK